MTATRSDRLGRSLKEFVVIVVGVLVALWIDAGWSWLQDRQDEATLLRDLRSDFVANLAMAEDVAERRRTTADLGTRLIQGGVAAFPDDSLDVVYRAAFAMWTLNPRTGALESALSAGRIDLLRNDDLRSALAGWSGYLTDAEEETQSMVPRFLELYVATSAAVVRGAGSRDVLQQVLNDPELTGIIAMKASAFAMTVSEVDELVYQTRLVVDLLNAELNEDS